LLFIAKHQRNINSEIRALKRYASSSRKAAGTEVKKILQEGENQEKKFGNLLFCN
jgi:hypothetical protein